MSLTFSMPRRTDDLQSAMDRLMECKLAEAFGVPQVLQAKPLALGPAKALLALTYSLGQWFLVPWDLYMDNDPKTGQPGPRYFGSPKDWGKFYDFIHDHRNLFDGYQTTAEVGVVINADNVNSATVEPICQRLFESQVPFRVMAAASQFNRVPLDAHELSSVRLLVLASPEASFAAEDRQALGKAREGTRTVL